MAAAAAALALSASLPPILARQTSKARSPAPPQGGVTLEPESTLEGRAAQGTRAAEGDRFPPLKLQVLPPGGTKLAPLDLEADVAHRPIVFVYFLMEYQISEDILAEVREFVKKEVKDKVALYPVTRLGRGRPLTELIERVKLLGIEEPVIVDEDGLLQHTLGAGTVPNISLIDHKGIYCFKNATTLKEEILQGIDLAESIRMAVRGEDPPVVFGLQPYYPVNDFIGSRFMDFTLPDYKTGDGLKLSDHVRTGRLIVLLYWSPHCPYSRRVMPEVVMASRTFHDKYLDVISVVRMKSGETKDEIETYAKATGVTFPILEDRGHKFTNSYRVTSTPTMIVVRPDGTIDSVYSSSDINFFTIIMTKVNAYAAKPAFSPAPSTPPKPRP